MKKIFAPVLLFALILFAASPPNVILNRSHPLAQGLITAWMMQEGGGQNCFNAVLSSTPATLTSGAVYQQSVQGNCVSFDGTNDYGSASANLSSARFITISFWLNWTTYANNDKMAMEFTSNGASNPGGFFIDPNSSAPHSGFVQLCFTSTVGQITHGHITRPSAGDWHHWAIICDQSVNPNIIVAYIDGVEQSVTYGAQGTGAATFANSTLYIMSRSGSALFGAGLMNRVMIYGRRLSKSEVIQLYKDPYCMFVKPKKFL